MYDWITDEALVALVGLCGGVLLGLAARLGRFCTMGAIEDLLYGGSDLRMRMWVLAIGVAIMGTFGLAASGLLELETSYYMSIRWMPVAAVLGGLMFGYGMALAGNCGYGCIARLGGGDFRAFVIVLIMGVTAYLVLSGPLAFLRAWAFPQMEVAAGETPPGIAHLLNRWFGLSVPLTGIAIGAAITLGALWSPALRQDRKAVFWSVVVAAAIVSGWAGSYWVYAGGFTAMPVVSHSFSAPVGETLLYAMT